MAGRFAQDFGVGVWSAIASHRTPNTTIDPLGVLNVGCTVAKNAGNYSPSANA